MELAETYLFKGTRIPLDGIQQHTFEHGSAIALENDNSTSIGIVLEGRILIKAYTESGNDYTLLRLEPDTLFGELILFSRKTSCFLGTLVAEGTTKIATIPYKQFKDFLYNDRDLLHNFLTLLSEKAVEFNCKSKLLSQDTVRDKILFYLNQEIEHQKNKTILLGMTKEALANELNVQRPSLSRELIKMKQEGIIDYDRKTITLL